MEDFLKRNLVRINTRLHNTGSEFVGRLGNSLKKTNQPIRFYPMFVTIVSTTMTLEATTVNFNKVTSARPAPVKGENP